MIEPGRVCSPPSSLSVFSARGFCAACPGSEPFLPVDQILSIVVLLLFLGALAGLWLFPDTLSLWFWRMRYFRLPRAVGTGPREVIAATASSPVGVRLVGICEEEWRISNTWVPPAQSTNLASPRTIITLGCWWDGAWQTTPLPTDTNGTFVAALAPATELAHAPLQNQIAYQAAAAAGEHIITPPVIGARGDGFFLVLEVTGLDACDPVRDRGQARRAHPMFGHGDPNSIQALSVSTAGEAAQIGDLALALFSLDPLQNPDVKIELPPGWTPLGHNDVALQNIGYRACCRLVTEPGRQSVACAWTDDSTFVAEATLVIFGAAR